MATDITNVFLNHSAACIWGAGILFGVSHTLLAGHACRARAAACGIGPTTYRLLYSLLAALLTGLWLWLAHALPDAPIYSFSGSVAVPFYALQTAGLVIILLSLRAFDAAIFLGLKTMPESGEAFVEHGIYRHMRHPMYTGFMLLLLASPVHSVNSLHFCLAVSVYFIIGSHFEERRMLGRHPAYAEYRRRVPAFVPRMGLFRPPGAAQ